VANAILIEVLIGNLLCLANVMSEPDWELDQISRDLRLWRRSTATLFSGGLLVCSPATLFHRGPQKC
jgi:hypothetical protein